MYAARYMLDWYLQCECKNSFLVSRLDTRKKEFIISIRVSSTDYGVGVTGIIIGGGVT